MAQTTKTQVLIVGAGPSGLMLSQLLHLNGIESVILERSSQAHVESRIRAGVLEWGSVECIRAAGIGARMDKEGLVHDGFDLGFDGEAIRIDLKGLTGKSVMVYGQTELTKDLIDARLQAGGQIMWEAEDVALHGLDGVSPSASFTQEGARITIEADFIACCDGYHGVGRKSIPKNILKQYERMYPFGWLGLLADVQPCHHELIYANHARGFALCSQRSETRSRYYVQVPADDKVEGWNETRFFDELEQRLSPAVARNLTRGPALEMSIAPLRSFVAEPLNYGRMFLAGDAMHIVPPTGAKGLNMALADVRILSEAFTAKFKGDSDYLLTDYSRRALDRVWKVERFSWWMSELLHQFDHHTPFEKRMQRAEFDHLAQSEAAQKSLAENYVGLPI